MKDAYLYHRFPCKTQNLTNERLQKSLKQINESLNLCYKWLPILVSAPQVPKHKLSISWTINNEVYCTEANVVRNIYASTNDERKLNRIPRTRKMRWWAYLNLWDEIRQISMLPCAPSVLQYISSAVHPIPLSVHMPREYVIDVNEMQVICGLQPNFLLV